MSLACASRRKRYWFALGFLIILLFYIIIYNYTQYIDIKYFLDLLFAFIFAVLVAHYPISFTVGQLWEAIIKTEEDPKSHFSSSAFIGGVERALYVVALLAGKPEGIGLWLTLKTIGRIWNNEAIPGAIPREVYQIFLIGTALSIAYAVVGASFVEWLPSKPIFAFIACMSLLLSNLILCWLIKRDIEKRRNNRPFSKE